MYDKFTIWKTTAFKKKAKKQQLCFQLTEPGIEPGISGPAVWCATYKPPRQLDVSVVDKLLNYFNVMGPNKNTKLNVWSTLFQPCVFL